MFKGKVKEYDSSRGCGVIVDYQSGQHLTVYANYIDLKKDEILKAGQEVEFDIENNRHRNWAINVTIL
jgi:cold shock CspA family protein